MSCSSPDQARLSGEICGSVAVLVLGRRSPGSGFGRGGRGGGAVVAALLLVLPRRLGTGDADRPRRRVGRTGSRRGALVLPRTVHRRGRPPRCLPRVASVGALTIASEVGDWRRFPAA